MVTGFVRLLGVLSDLYKVAERTGRIDPALGGWYCVARLFNVGGATTRHSALNSHAPPMEWRQMPDDARKDDRQQDSPTTAPKYQPVDLVRAANSLIQQAPMVHRAIEAYERAKELPSSALDFKISL